MRVKLFSCTLETYTVLFVNYITIELEDKKQRKKRKQMQITDPDILLRQRNTFILLIKIKKKILKEREKSLKTLNCFKMYLFIYFKNKGEERR